MIRIVEGSLEEVRAEMQEAKKAIQFKLKGYRKTCYKHGKFIGTKFEKQEISRLEKLLHLHGVSRFMPVKIGSNVVNYKLLESFSKKLRDLRPTISVNEDGLMLRYEGVKHRKGLLELYDMTTYYEDLKNIPVAEIMD